MCSNLENYKWGRYYYLSIKSNIWSEFITLDVHSRAPYMMLHSQEMRANLARDQPLRLKGMKYTNVHLSYEVVRLRRLRKPYSPSCSIQSQIEFSDCLSRCVRSNSRSVLKADIIESCYLYCNNRRCELEYYRILPSALLRNKWNNVTQINVRPSGGISILYEFIPKMNLVDLLVYLGSILGMYIGIDIISVLNLPLFGLKKKTKTLDPKLRELISFHVNMESKRRNDKLRSE